MPTSKQTKLTLVVDPTVVRRAKSFASAHDTSVSSLVEAFLSQLTSDDPTLSTVDPDSLPPTTRALYGSLHNSDTDSFDAREEKIKRLTEKYLHD